MPMNLFDKLVDEALNHQPSLSSLRMVVEKELLHHDILRIMSQNNLLLPLTFIGGTCLRACYNGVRLSEDLDFTGGHQFSRDSLSSMGQSIRESLEEKYGLTVKVSDPVKEIKNVDTWKIKIETHPEQKHLPAQRINIDICAVPSYEKQPMMLLNRYGIDLGTNGLVLQAQSREEIYADKLLAFALRPNRIKYRDLWDIIWLYQQGYKPNLELIPNKLRDRQINSDYFLNLFTERCTLLSTDPHLRQEFKHEMQRFLPLKQIQTTLEQNQLWTFITYLMNDFISTLAHVNSVHN
jgi:predicted nucleotidyltransferase component of viral defense system